MSENHSQKKSITRIGVFYDGNYFFHVSNYYNYIHSRKARISIAGLHDFIRIKVNELESHGDFRNCQIVDAHYFRARLNAKEASQKGNQLYYDRVFDDILMSEGVTTHYLPLKSYQGHVEEKGVDIWLALEAFELAIYKQFDVVVLIASDGNFVPLVRKLNTLGTRVMLISWEFSYTDDYGNERITKTSQDLQEIVTYPLNMFSIIESPGKNDNSLVDSLFVPSSAHQQKFFKPEDEDFEIEANGNSFDEKHVSEILSIKDGYGFVKYPPHNLFFHFSNVNNADFNQLQPGDEVSFRLTLNDRGEEIATDLTVL